MKNLFFASLTLLLFVVGCDDDPDPVVPETQDYTVSLKHYWGINALEMNAWYTTSEGDSFMTTTFDYHINNFEWVDADGQVHAQDDWKLVRYGTDGDITLTFPGQSDMKIAKLRFTIGVEDSTTNASGALNEVFTDPMYWGMAMGYINMKVEGKTMMGGTEGNAYFHIGGYLGANQTARNIELEFSTPLESVLGKNTASVKVDLAQFFYEPNTIQLSTTNDVQTVGNTAVMISQNWDSMFSVME